MAPKPKNQIVTLDDVRHRTSADGPPTAASSLENPTATTRKRPQAQFHGNSSGYCQPAGGSTGGDGIPCSAIPGLPQSDVCDATLKRIHQEFLPIIRRRGYNVRSISEFCCCGDGLDHAANGQTHGRNRRRRMENNVLGYNQTSFGRHHQGSSNKKFHTIHLRLRRPQRHSELFPWEDVAGTMAHELAHCVHGPHDDAFFKLMEEILEEHCMTQVYGPSGPGWLRPVNAGTVQREARGDVAAAVAAATPSALMPQSGGQRLGGNSQTGTSRLVDAIAPLGGRRLGGARSNVSPRQLRELVAAAAEARHRQMERVRRMMEKSGQPCVIELLDDSDDEDSNTTSFDRKPPAKRPMKKEKKTPECIELLDDSDDEQMKRKKPKSASAKGLFSAHQKGSTHGNETAPRKTQQPAPESFIDLTKDVESATVPASVPIDCGRCTYKNRPKAVLCAMCSSRL